MNKLEQQILIKKIKKGDGQAFGKIYDEYIKKIYRFIFYRVPTKEIAEDLTHDVFANLLTYLQNNSRQVENLQALIYQIARNIIAGYYSGSEIKIQDGDISQIDFKLSEEGYDQYQNQNDNDLEKKMDQELSLDIIHQALREMTNTEYREVIILRLIEDMSHAEIARIMGKKTGAVRVQLHRALNQLKKIILSKIKND